MIDPLPTRDGSALRGLLEQKIKYFRDCRDAPMTRGNKVEIATIRKTLNVVVCELEALLTGD